MKPESPRLQSDPNTTDKPKKVEDDIISKYPDLESLFSSIRQFTKVFLNNHINVMLAENRNGYAIHLFRMDAHLGPFSENNENFFPIHDPSKLGEQHELNELNNLVIKLEAIKTRNPEAVITLSDTVL